MKKPLTLSVVIHGALVLLAIFGLPHIFENNKIEEPVPVEIMTNAQVAELTSSNKPPVKAQPPKEEPKKEEPPPPQKKEPAPKQASTPPPPDETLKAPPKEEPKKEELAVKKEPKKEQPKKPDKKPPPKKEEPKKDDQESEMDKLLKDLDPNTDPPQPDTPEPTKANSTPEPSPDVSRFSEVLTMSELDALRAQLSGCWSIMAGSANAQDLSVEVRITIGADNTAINPQVISTARLGDPTYKAAADAALRALRNPRCTPLNLPPGKYSGQTMVINFDPKDMF